MRLEDILAPVSSELEIVESRLRGWAEGDLPIASDAVGHIVGAGGKRLRPACVLLAAGLGQNRHEHNEKAIEFATTVEIIHTASLVHDDIVDGAPVRRGEPTLHARWGSAVALLIGDLLYSRLFRRLTEDGREGASAAAAETIHRMVLGELAETVRRDELSVTEPEYLEIVGNKTGALFSCSAYLGGQAAGIPREGCERLRRYGSAFGRAYQIVDDVLDLCEDETDARVAGGKPVGADLREGKVTLPVIHALEHDARAGADRVSRLFRQKNRSELREAALELGSVSYAVARAEEACREAESCLDGFPEGPYLRGLVGMGEYVAQRGREALARDAAAALAPEA